MHRQPGRLVDHDDILIFKHDIKRDRLGDGRDRLGGGRAQDEAIAGADLRAAIMLNAAIAADGAGGDQPLYALARQPLRERLRQHPINALALIRIRSDNANLIH